MNARLKTGIQLTVGGGDLDGKQMANDEVALEPVTAIRMPHTARVAASWPQHHRSGSRVALGADADAVGFAVAHGRERGHAFGQRPLPDDELGPAERAEESLNMLDIRPARARVEVAYLRCESERIVVLLRFGPRR